MQLNVAMIKGHIVFKTTSRIISETVWSSNASFLAGLLQGEFLFFYIISMASNITDCKEKSNCIEVYENL